MDTSSNELLNETDNRKRGRDQVSSCSSDESFSSNSPISKKPNNSNMSGDLKQALTALQKAQEDMLKTQQTIQDSISKLAKSDDVKDLRADLYSEINKLTERLDGWKLEYQERVERIESKIMDIEISVDAVKKDNELLVEENDKLKKGPKWISTSNK